MKNNIKLICFDLNKTLITENTWLQLNLAMGISKAEDQSMLDQYLQGKLTYEGAQQLLAKLYIERGKATKANILDSIYHYHYIAGAKETVAYLQAQGYRISLISGSIDLLVARVAQELGIEYYLANNQFVFDANDYLSQIVCLGDDSVVKVQQLKELSIRLDIPVNQMACVGDGDNDLGLFDLTGHGITFKGSKIESHAWKVIDQLLDLKKVL
jgi:phosphoserine phosphatase